MATSARIGLYLTDRNIVLAESDAKIKKILSTAITPGSASQDVPLHSDITEEIHVVGGFQKLLRENKIESPNVCISIPIEEIFLRSFVVPPMPAGELSNVVFYEAKKYVPFDLKLLDYVYQAFPFVENKQKRLRVIFYAVRKQTLEKYDRIFKQTNCKPVIYEPSLVSLSKYLVTQKQLRVDQKTVVIYTRENYGQIIFYEKGVAYFVREFSLALTEVVHDSKAVPDVLRAQLLREIRKSFGFYSRQFSHEKIKEILIVSSDTDQELVKNLAEEFSAKVRVMDSSVKIGLQKVIGMEAMCAAGVALAKNPSGLPPFNFLQAKPSAASQPAPASGVLPPFVSQLFSWDKSDLIYAIQALVVCGLLLLVGFLYGHFTLDKVKKQSDQLTQRQGALSNKSIEEIEADIKHNKSQVATYEKLLHESSRMTAILVHLTKALSEGMWYQSVDVQGDSNSVTVALQGFVTPTAVEGEQFRLVQAFLLRLKNDPVLSSINFKLNTVQKKNAGDRDAFYFLITGAS